MFLESKALRLFEPEGAFLEYLGEILAKLSMKTKNLKKIINPENDPDKILQIKEQICICVDP